MYEDEIARGMIALESNFGDDFHLSIDLGELDMFDTNRCVLGQVAGRDHDGDYCTALELLSWTSADAVAHGFEVPEDGRSEAEYGRSTAEWRRVLEARSVLDVPGESAEEAAEADA